MKLNQLSASQFADEIGVQRSSISHVLTGRNKPSLEFIQKVIKRFPKVDSGWLLNGTTNVVPKEDRISLKEQSVESIIETKNEESVFKKEVNSLVKEKNAQEDKKEGKRIKRILVFYSDNTFEEFNPA